MIEVNTVQEKYVSFEFAAPNKTLMYIVYMIYSHIKRIISPAPLNCEMILVYDLYTITMIEVNTKEENIHFRFFKHSHI